MNTNKIIVGGIVGGIVFFFLGWLVYGMLLMDYMEANSNTCMNRAADDMVWWAMILGNLCYGVVFAFILDLAKIENVMAGVKIGLIFSLLLAVSQALYYYSMTTMYSNFTMVAVDIIASVFSGVVVAAAVAWVMTRGK